MSYTRTFTVAALAILTTGALASAQTVYFERSALSEVGFNGGEFVANLSSGTTYRTFCLEINEPISMGDSGDANYLFNITTDGAVNGGVSGGSPDPVSSAAASIFVAWLNGSIAQSTENSTAVQNAIWVIEGERDPSALSGIALSLYSDAVANFSTTDNAAIDNPIFSDIRVLNPYRIIDGQRFDYQSQIVLVPLPASSALALAGLALCATRRR